MFGVLRSSVLLATASVCTCRQGALGVFLGYNRMQKGSSMAQDNQKIPHVTGTPKNRGRLLRLNDSLTGIGRLAPRTAASMPAGTTATHSPGTGSVVGGQTGAATASGATGSSKE